MAMANQQFCLRWNNYQTNLTQVFDQLFQSESFVDVTLACEGQSLKAHRMVLSACSPYFQELLSDAPCSHPVIILQGVKWNELRAVVEFMYKGEININQDELGSLLRVAEYLKIRGLAEVDGDPAETAVLTSPSISPATRTPLALSALNDESPVTSVLAAARKRRRLSGGDELISRPTSPLTPTSAPEMFEHVGLDLQGLPGQHIRGGGSAPLPGSPVPFANLASPHLQGPMPPPQMPTHLTHLPHLPPLSPLLNMHSLSRPHMHDDFEIRPGIAEMIREEERRRRDAPDMAKLLESSHHWMGTSMAVPQLSSSLLVDSYQAQVQAAWQKSWNQTQSLLQNLRFRERGPLKSWRPETMAEAIHAVLKEGLSLSQAARKYDIPYPTFVLYANRVHNLLGPSQEPGDLRPKGRGRPQRILLGSWPEDQIKGVIRAVVFRDTSVFKDNEHKMKKENKHPAAPKLQREDNAGQPLVRPNGPILPSTPGGTPLPVLPLGTPDNGSFSTNSTPAPNTPAPNTPAPNLSAPSTPASNTPAPNTPAPNTPIPGNQAPGTPIPTTPLLNPNISGPNTPTSITSAPLTPSALTPAPSTPAPPTTPAPSTPVPIPSSTPSAMTPVAQPLTTPPTPGSIAAVSTAGSPAGSPASNDSRIGNNVAALGSSSPTSSSGASAIATANHQATTLVSSSKSSPVFSVTSNPSTNSNGSFASNGANRDPATISADGQQQQQQMQTSQQQQQHQQQHQQQQVQQQQHLQQQQQQQQQQMQQKHHHQQQELQQQQRQQQQQQQVQPHLQQQQQQQQQYALQQQMQYQPQQTKVPQIHSPSQRLPQAPHLQMQQQLQQLQQQQQQQQQQPPHPQRHQLPHHQQQPSLPQQKPVQPRQAQPQPQPQPQPQAQAHRHSQASQNQHRQAPAPQIGGLLPTGIPPSLATSLNSPVHLARLFGETNVPHPFTTHQSQHPQAPISPFHPGYPRHPHPSAAMQVLSAMNTLNPHASRMGSEEPEPSPEAILFSKITNPLGNPGHIGGDNNARPSPAHNQFENLGDPSSSLSGLVERASMIYRDGLDSIKSEPEPILN